MSPDNTHKRPSSSGAKKAHSKGLKPGAEPSKKKGVLKNGKGSHSRNQSEDDTMTSFPQFCATCEKQIITPDVRILFCSRECHRQDRLSKANSIIPTDLSPPRTPISESHSFESLNRHPQILQQRSPTSPYDATNRYSISSISSIEDVRPRVHREPSDASRWLGSFHSSTNLQETAEQAEHQTTPRRPKIARGHSAAPSLSYTSTSSCSAAGMSLPRTPYSLHSTSYGAVGAPLPSRNNPYSPSSYAPKSVELVQPMMMLSMAAPETTDTDEESSRRKASVTMASSQDTIVQGEILGYEKRSVDTLRSRGSSAAAMSPGRGSLKQMFAFAAMQSGPGSPTGSGAGRTRPQRTFMHTHHD